MAGPYVPTPATSPIVNPAVGSTGAPPIAYLSNSEWQFAPTGMTGKDLNPGGTAADQAQSLADVIRRASSWADAICFGADAATKGASLAASLTVDQATIRIKSGELRLICDYRPLVQLVGVATGSGLGSLSAVPSDLIVRARPGRRSWTIPFPGAGAVYRSGDAPAFFPGGIAAGSVYAVWSYVSGYPHTSLAADVAANATSCVVNATDGSGGVWGVFAASGAFPGTQLTLYDGANTESVVVQSITTGTPSANQTTLTTSPFANAHTIPSAPDFIPVTAIPPNVNQAVISLTTMLIKTRGIRGFVLPTTPGGHVTQSTHEKLGQAGALEDYEVARHLLEEGGFIVHMKHPGSY